MENTIKKRAVAFNCKIKDLLAGEFVKEEGEFAPSYVIIGENKVSRVNLAGIIVSKEGPTLMLDDSSGRIALREFAGSTLLEGFSVGEVVIVIGRIRQFHDDRYLQPEIIKKTTTQWLALRKLQLQHKQPFLGEGKPAEEKPTAHKQAEKEEVDLLQTIAALDQGKGADMEAVLAKVGKDQESEIKKLLLHGEIFEVTPGKLKVLE